MTSLNYQGHLFDEQTDWLAFIRDAINSRSSAGLRDDVPDIRSALSQLGEDLTGSDLQQAYFDGLLRIVETGSLWERNQIRGLPYADAPDGIDRLRTVLEEKRESYRAEQWISSLLECILKRRPDDARALAILRDEVIRPSRTSADMMLAAQYLSTWFNDVLPSLGFSPTGHDVYMWLTLTKERAQLINAIAASGAHFIAALGTVLDDTQNSEEVRNRFRGDLAKHPAYAGILK